MREAQQNGWDTDSQNDSIYVILWWNKVNEQIICARFEHYVIMAISAIWCVSKKACTWSKSIALPKTYNLKRVYNISSSRQWPHCFTFHKCCKLSRRSKQSISCRFWTNRPDIEQIPDSTSNLHWLCIHRHHLCFASGVWTFCWMHWDGDGSKNEKMSAERTPCGRIWDEVQTELNVGKHWKHLILSFTAFDETI